MLIDSVAFPVPEFHESFEVRSLAVAVLFRPSSFALHPSFSQLSTRNRADRTVARVALSPVHSVSLLSFEPGRETIRHRRKFLFLDAGCPTISLSSDRPSSGANSFFTVSF